MVTSSVTLHSWMLWPGSSRRGSNSFPFNHAFLPCAPFPQCLRLDVKQLNVKPLVLILFVRFISVLSVTKEQCWINNVTTIIIKYLFYIDLCSMLVFWRPKKGQIDRRKQMYVLCMLTQQIVQIKERLDKTPNEHNFCSTHSFCSVCVPCKATELESESVNSAVPSQ